MKIGNGLQKRIVAAAGGCLLAAAVSVSPAGGEALWEPGFSGYLSPRGSVAVGDVLLVEITPNTELNLQSSHIDSEEARLSFSGGEGAGLFDFLPEGSSSSEQSIEQEDSYELSTRVAVRVTDRDENGLPSLRGERAVEINGLRERIVLS